MHGSTETIFQTFIQDQRIIRFVFASNKFSSNFMSNMILSSSGKQVMHAEQSVVPGI
jgi:hypothetical protein